MIKMYQCENDIPKLCKISFDEEHNEFVICHGRLGEKGECYTEKKPFFTMQGSYMKKLAKEQLEKGYRYVDEDMMEEFIIHIPLDNTSFSKENAIKQTAITGVVSKCLDETDNGFVDAEDSRKNSMNIYGKVLHVGIAVERVIQCLMQSGLLEGVVIGHLGTTGQYNSDYPEKGKPIEIS